MALRVDARRVVAYLSIHHRSQPLSTLATDLWPGVESGAALGLLDEALADVDVPGLLVVDTLAGTVVLDSAVAVDLDEAMALVRMIPEVPATEVTDTELLRADVLPSWTAPWIAVERERFRQLRLNALEDLSLRFSAAGDHEQAVGLASVAVKAAPSRENARRALIEAHLAQGDLAAAVAEYDDYQELLRSSVGGPIGSNLDMLFPPSPAWPVVRGFRPMAPRSAVALPGLRAVRTPGSRRLVAGGSIPSGR
ncbi:BTAD domain-containing protein [Pseudonocardia sp. N23]|uniref:AfsR/SARP family transcriptional regulator n=1 Tax=Pseudonocardia sp. N23 TaxID=1987376 RepID=UPI000C029829|nr:BTAD domain-containing protein [Pseudonocardia sp. N23]GAY10780.1 transcriptional regulator, SARP family [Pseudonocardia sp. N23]